MAVRRSSASEEGAPGAETQSTRARLVSVAASLIDEHGEWGVKLDDVLAASGASASSVYHFFGNLRGLVDEAQVQRFTEARFFDVLHFRDAVAGVQTREELRALVDTYLRGMIAASRVPGRARRLSALASSQHNSAMRSRLAALETESLDDVAAGLADLQSRGLVDASIDPRTVAAVASGLLFSRSLPELIGDDDLQRAWDDRVVALITAELGLQA